MTRALVASASAITSSPPTTRLSLLASARSMPSPSVATVGPRPADPVRALRTRSAPEETISSTRPSLPASTSPPVHSSAARAAADSSESAMRSTPRARVCSSSSSWLEPAASATTCSSSLPWTTSMAWVPMDPVEPAITTFRTRLRLDRPDDLHDRFDHLGVELRSGAALHLLDGRPA